MPPTPEIVPIRVLVTGFGPFSRTPNNPSWLAVKDLNGTYIKAPTGAVVEGAMRRPIHITSFEIPVVYSSVLKIVPPLHERPPRLPSPEDLIHPVVDPGLLPPPAGYDFIMHVGLGRKGGLSLEKLGRKEPYRIKDVDGQLAPIITTGGPSEDDLQSDAVRFEAERATGSASGGTSDDPKNSVRRGFAEGYESFPHELWSTLDVDAIVEHIKSDTGIQEVISSQDAGLYLCEFLNYCCMAESRRERELTREGETRSKVLFVHIPPIGENLELDQITSGLVSIMKYVCWGS
ncbi:peptidase C15, pyroglutamyl peptidase I-like protein [Clavulina sp. PMI_390]|nr:peptidase C15, pyroglutamyl peptidase I-like protein [Clavulina sp. PMI_390]